MLWERRDDWQKTDASILYGEPKPKYIAFRAFGPDEKRVIAMVQNEVDILTDVTPESWDLIREKNAKTRVWMDKFPWANMNDPCQRGIAFNDSTPPYDKKAVRWALALATNITAVSISTFSGMLRFSPIMVPPIQVIMDTYDKPMVPDLTAFRLDDGYAPFDPDVALRLADRLRHDGVENIPTDPAAVRDLFGVGWWKFDPAESGKLLESVGFKRGAGNRWMLPDGTPWKMTINAPTISRSKASALPSPSPTNGNASASTFPCSNSKAAPSSPPTPPAISRPAPTGRPAPSAPTFFPVLNTGTNATSARPARPRP